MIAAVVLAFGFDQVGIARVLAAGIVAPDARVGVRDLHRLHDLRAADARRRGARAVCADARISAHAARRLSRVTERMNLPFTGIATFAKVPYAPELATLDADVAIIGAPYDLGTQVRSGTRLGPRGIRNASTIYGMRTPRYYDAEFDEIYLDGVRIVDCGDVDMVHGDPRRCLDNIQEAIGAILARGVLPSRSVATTPCRSRSCARTATPASTASASSRSTRTSTSSTSASACGRDTAT